MRLSNGQAWLDLDPHGAKIADASLCVCGQHVQPFFQNPWREDPRQMDALTRHLGGEWPCVPFGVPEPPATLPADWMCEAEGTEWHQHSHGYGAHSVWSFSQKYGNRAVAEISYPDACPIVGLKRTVFLASESEIQLGLEIEVRRDVQLPIGLHPVMSLADAAPGSAVLAVADDDDAWTFPVDVEPGRSYLQADQRGVPLSALANSTGGQVDARRLPFPANSEDLVLLTAPGGCVSLTRPERGYRVDVLWDEDDFPSCLLWLSNRGRDYAPWDGRVCAVGIEPVAAAFDLGIGHSASADTPLACSGVRTAVALRQGDIWRTNYTIAVNPA